MDYNYGLILELVCNQRNLFIYFSCKRERSIKFKKYCGKNVIKLIMPFFNNEK